MNTSRTALICLLVCSIGMSGGACTSTKTIRPVTEPGTPVFGPVKAGDKVTLLMSDGRRLDIRVAEVDDEGVVSMEGVRYLRKDITHVERQSVSAVKTAALVGGIVFGALVVAGMMIASALTGFQ